MKISIITVCYNAEKTIERAIDSVYKQTSKDFEYIFIDGKSTDTTLNIIKKNEERFLKKGITYRFISEQDKGLYDAMNKGAMLAEGEWIIYLNADDELASKNSIQSIKKYISDDIDVIYGSTIVINNEREYIERAKSIDSIKKHLPFIPQSAAIKRKIQLDYKFNLEYKISADFDSFLRMYLGGCKFMEIDKIISKFYFGGVSNKNIWKTYKEDITIKDRYGIIKKNSLLQILKYLRVRLKTIFIK